MEIRGVFSGDARETPKPFLVIRLLLTFAFVIAFRGSSYRPTQNPEEIA